MEQPYSYEMHILDEDGSVIGNAPIDVDWEPALEAARLAAVRRGGDAGEAFRLRGEVVPDWHADLGRPFTSGFRVALEGSEPTESHDRFTTTYFAVEARRVSAELVAQGKLREGQTFRYTVSAAASNGAAESRGPRVRTKLRIEATTPSPPIHRGRLELAARGSATHGELDAGDLPVFLPEHVMNEVAVLTREAGARECGGVLTGRLVLDPGVPELFVRVEAQLPAEQAQGELTRLSFTPEVWTDLRVALDRRVGDEIMLGWWHSHPADAWNCKDCPIERRRVCPLAKDFFSDQDRALHRAVFSRAFSIALVVNRIATNEQSFSLFGWRQGRLVPRGFHVLTEGPVAA